jgi:TolA-binding protein
MVSKNAIKLYILKRIIMKRTLLYSLTILGFSTLLVQCVATQKDMEYTNVQVKKVDSKVEDIDKEIAELKKQTVQEVQVRQAETGDRLDYHQSEILRLQSELEESNMFIRQVQAENNELKKQLLARLETSERSNAEEINRLKERLTLTGEQLLKAHDRVTFTENEIIAIKDARSREAAQRAMEASQKAREAERKARIAAEREAAEQKAAKKKTSSRGPRDIWPDKFKIDASKQDITESTIKEEEEKITVSKPVEKKATPPPTVKSSYDKGMTLYQQKKYQEAYDSFTAYLDKNPAGSQAVSARYYAAQCLYEKKDYELSILEFQKVIVEHPKHSLAPKALYKQGIAFEKIGDPEKEKAGCIKEIASRIRFQN